MNRYIRLLIGLLLSGILLASCKQEIPKIVDLQLSASQLTFDRGTDTQEVAVQASNNMGTEQGWTYAVTPQVEWLKLSASESKLSVSTQENPTGKIRKASIAILTGSTIKHIEVTQKASDLSISIGLNHNDSSNDDPQANTLTISTFGDQKLVAINANTEEWSVLPIAEEWLEVIPLRDSNAVKVTAIPNPTNETRQALITISSGETTATFTVVQKGQLVYFVPYQENHKKVEFKDLIAHEEARGFKFVSRDFANPSFGSADRFHFITASPKLTRLKYIIREKSDFAFNEVELDLSDPKEFQEGGGYFNYLKDLGYKERYNSKPERPVLIAPDGFLLAKLMQETKIGRYYVQFEPQYVPDRAMPTFNELPYYSAEVEKLLTDNVSKYSEVDAWETTNGSKRIVAINTKDWGTQYADEWFLSIYQTNQESDNSKKEFRFYEYFNSIVDKNNPDKIGLVKSIRLCYNDIEKIIFITSIKDGNVNFRTTPEFEALAEKEGYIFHGMGSNGVSFVNKEKGLKMVVLLFTDKNVFGADKTASIKFEKLPPAKPTTNTAIPSTDTSSKPCSEPCAATAILGKPFSPNHNRQ